MGQLSGEHGDLANAEAGVMRLLQAALAAAGTSAGSVLDQVPGDFRARYDAAPGRFYSVGAGEAEEELCGTGCVGSCRGTSPARAGKPRSQSSHTPVVREHPRARGETKCLALITRHLSLSTQE
jgi:hypothetical protein